MGLGITLDGGRKDSSEKKAVLCLESSWTLGMSLDLSLTLCPPDALHWALSWMLGILR